jgi:chemotaxis protein MotB
MSIRRKRRHEPHEESGPDERWMASYLDMVTVLMCMFIVLFAMSTVDKDKFEALSNSLATGFGQKSSVTVDAAKGVVVPAELLDEDAEGFADIPLVDARAEFDELSALRDKLRAALQQKGLESTATLTIDERGLTIGLVSADTYFGTNSTRLSTKAVTVLNALGGVLVDVPNQISVEGHADRRSAAAPFPTNWELSAGRSTQVLRYLVEKRGLDPGHIKSVGFGDAHPVATGSSSRALAQNRRVDIVVLSDAREEVRRLLPQLQAAQQPY